MYKILLNYFPPDEAYSLYCAYRLSIDYMLELLSEYDVPIWFWDYIIDIDDSMRYDLFDCERDNPTIPVCFWPMECSNIHLISYLNEGEIIDILIEKQCQINHAVYIFHDKDDNVPHYHIVIKLLRSRDIDVVRRWFVIDERNTLARKNTFSNSSVIDYFRHTNQSSVEDGKHEYSISDIKFFNCNIDTFLSREDKSFSILEEYLSGVPLYDIAKSHGKDFIYHIQHYKTLVELIERERQKMYDIEVSMSEDCIPINNWSDLPFEPHVIHR